jgi:glycogen phosphorylase
VLAGDHLKAASDLDLPLVGVGLFYRQGFFRQELVPGSGQVERYHDLTGAEMVGLRPCPAPRPRSTWAMSGGGPGLAGRRRPGAAVPARHPRRRQLRAADHITDRLYGGDQEHRVRQEMILGVGGVRALRSMGMAPRVYHLNEGHAGFLALERIRAHIVSTGVDLRTAVDAVRQGLVFTTHTPVPAGIDRFPRELIETYLGGWAAAIGVESTS